jgi:serine/threonine protein kinase
MGVVYEALDVERNTRVALKTLARATTEAIVRFKREFRALQDIHHANLVALGDLVSTGDRWFFSMELVDGVDFLDYVRPTQIVAAPRDSPSVADDTMTSDATMPFEYDPSAPPVTGRFDERRLRAVLPQLVDGVAALHAANKVHRDIKPSNIRVTPSGRLVLLDFGLVLDTMSASQALDMSLVGTPAYMAPEQAASDTVGPAADWYSIGVLLYEALTGRVPFEGSPLEMFMRKQKDEPQPPSELAPGVPEDLEKLCMRLLRFDPTKRPNGAEILRRLYVPATSRMPARSSSSLGQMTFVGRHHELEALDAALGDARASGAVTVIVSGVSGVGKSWLVRKFTDDIAATIPDALVLSGRCYERETVPYKAIDGVVDSLSQKLARLPPAEIARMLPAHTATLAQIFPVLRRVETIAKLSSPVANASLDPQELRRRAFGAMREMFRRIASERKLVVVIDDFHWADDDSLALLRDVLSPPDSPRMLLVATSRKTGGTGMDGSMRDLRKSDVDPLPGDVRTIHVTALPPEDARELAHRLLERAVPEKIGEAETIARETAGHPLFIDEMVRHVALIDIEGGRGAATLKLDEALWVRIGHLDPPARRIIEIVAVAGAPMLDETIARAAGLASADFERRLSLLRVANLVRTTGTHGSTYVEPLHNRVSQVVLSHLDADAQRSCHERLALALEALPSPDPQALTRHWRGAKDLGRAATYAIAAGDRAARALAFLRAMRFYQLALELMPDEDPRVREIHIRLGDTLATAGRGGAAAAEYQEAAKGAPAGIALELQRRAAEQLLRSGRFDDGMAATREVLAAIDLGLPSSPRRALLLFLLFRLVLWIRGFRFKERDRSLVPATELTRIDTCWSVSFSLALSDHVYGALFQTRMMLFALRAGEPTRVARALAMEVAYRATRGGSQWKLVQRRMIAARAVAERTRDAHALAFYDGAAGMAHYLNGDFARALELSESATRRFREEVTGAAWESGAAQLFAMNTLFYVGRLGELRARQQSHLRDALDRGDVYAAVNCRIGYPNFVWLAADDSESAKKHLSQAMMEWSKRGFHLEHFYALLAQTAIDLYDDRPEEALARIDAKWSALKWSLLLRIQSVNMMSVQMRARAALAASARAQGAAVEELLVRAERDARSVEKTRTWASPLATLVLAGVDARRGRARDAIAKLERAAAECDRYEMALFAALARRALGRLQGGETGQALVEKAEAWMRSETIRNAERVARALTPGL